MINFFLYFFEKFLILLIFTVFTEFNILFFEHYSIKIIPLKIQNVGKRTWIFVSEKIKYFQN